MHCFNGEIWSGRQDLNLIGGYHRVSAFWIFRYFNDLADGAHFQVRQVREVVTKSVTGDSK